MRLIVCQYGVSILAAFLLVSAVFYLKPLLPTKRAHVNTWNKVDLSALRANARLMRNTLKAVCPPSAKNIVPFSCLSHQVGWCFLAGIPAYS